VLAGPAGSGKSTFCPPPLLADANRLVDALRGWVSDDEGNQRVSATAFRLLYNPRAYALRRAPAHRGGTAQLWRRAAGAISCAWRGATALPVVLILLVADRALCLERDARRRRQVGAAVIDPPACRAGRCAAARATGRLRPRYQIDAREALQAAVTYEAAAIDRRDLGRPFDIIGDVHGCCGRARRAAARGLGT